MKTNHENTNHNQLQTMKYAIIIPAKNEEQSLPVLLDALIAQTLTPVAVIVVNDQSTDNTAAITETYTKKHPFIHHLKKQNRLDTYALGGKVVETFHYGLNYLNKLNIEYDYVVKMDADIHFDSSLFSNIASRVNDSKPTGIASCTPYTLENGERIYIHSPRWHTNGDFKVYNKTCLEEIGGLIPDLGWDCADNIIAMSKGWETKVFRDLYYQQSRPIGRHSVKKGIIRQGTGAYKLRYSMLYIAVKMGHDLMKPPYVAGSFYYLRGIIKARLSNSSRTLTKKQAKLLRKLLWESMMDRIKHKEYQIFQRKTLYAKRKKQTEVVKH